ncbi:hypothetical protein AWRI1631_131240, partial [Saccharomyces cerevisiae AWRI1631]
DKWWVVIQENPRSPRFQRHQPEKPISHLQKYWVTRRTRMHFAN